MSEQGQVPTGPVIVALDGSELAERALPVATWAAQVLGAGIELVSVAVDEDEAERLRAYLAATTSRPGLADAATTVPIGRDPAEVVRRTAEARPGSLVCLGSHGWGRAAGPLGSVATVVAGGLGQPVLVVGPHGAPGPADAPVVACVDGGPPSEAVLAPAVAWACRLGTPLDVLTVYEPVPEPERPSRHHRRHGPAGDVEAYLAGVAERAAALATGPFEGKLETRRVGVADPITPADGLRTHLREHPAQLVVVSSHARTGLARLVLGSEAGRIIGISPAPVLTVPLMPER